MDQSLDARAAQLEEIAGLAPVSVVIPCFRCHLTIGLAIESVLNQDWPPTELVLIEDCSADEGRTLAALAAIRSQYSGPVRIVLQSLPENRGAGEARNAGWAIANQEFVAFLDADDAWHPMKLAIQAQWMLGHPDYAFTCHDSVICQDLRQQPPIPEVVRNRDLDWKRLLYKNDIATRTVMLRRSTCLRFPQAVRYAEDYQLWLRILLGNEKGARLLSPLAFSFKRDFGVAGLSQNLEAMHQGVLDCLQRLRDERLISTFTWAKAACFEHIKYLRRIAISVAKR